MRVLVTGTEGYIGSLLAPLLMEDGHDVLGVDTGYYKRGWLFRGAHETPRTLVKDIRHVTAADLAGVEAVVHMAELSNDPAGDLEPEATYDINHAGSLRLARTSRECGVTRFIYTSSCSVYGIAGSDFVDEESPVNPQTAYAICKSRVETDVGALADERFSPVFLRNATAYGASPRMRFDIVLNNLAGLAHTTRVIAMTSDGTPWRPLVHALDICGAIRLALKAPREAIHNQVFNVGDTDHNYRIREVAEIVSSVFPACELSFGDPDPDNRSYRVRFDKIRRHLPEFRCEWDARRGAEQMREVFEAIAMDESVFRAPPFTRLKELRWLLTTAQIDRHFYWRGVEA